MAGTAMRWWRAFRTWRRSRPFWAGVFGLLAAMVLSMPVATIKVGALALTLQSLGGMSAALISVVLVCCAIGVWWRPDLRIPCGIVTMVAALVSLPNVNMGGFFLGLVCGLISGALALSWSPGAGSAAAENADGPAAERVRTAVADERTTGRGAPDEQTLEQPVATVTGASAEPVAGASIVDTSDAAVPAVSDVGAAPDAPAGTASAVRSTPSELGVVDDEETVFGVAPPAEFADPVPDVEQTLPRPAITDAVPGAPAEHVRVDQEPKPTPDRAETESSEGKVPQPAAARLADLSRGSRPYATPGSGALGHTPTASGPAVAAPATVPANVHPRPALRVVPREGMPGERPRGPVVPPVHPSQVHPLQPVYPQPPRAVPEATEHNRPPVPFVPPPPQLSAPEAPAASPQVTGPQRPRETSRTLGNPPPFVPPPAALLDGPSR